MKITLVIAVTALVANIYFAEPVLNNLSVPVESDTSKSIEPKNYYTLEDQLINIVLSRYHYNKFELNDSLSSNIFDRYIISLDHTKIYFIESDIESLEKYRYVLDDDIQAGNVEPFYDIFNVYLQRMQDRVTYLDTILSKEFDYSINEELLINRKNVDWSDKLSFTHHIR
ncbi:MAG: hypothetical protein P8X73_16655 [Ignavibacteriaceae bacterium]